MFSHRLEERSRNTSHLKGRNRFDGTRHGCCLPWRNGPTKKPRKSDLGSITRSRSVCPKITERPSEDGALRASPDGVTTLDMPNPGSPGDRNNSDSSWEHPPAGATRSD